MPVSNFFEIFLNDVAFLFFLCVEWQINLDEIESIEIK